MTNYTNSPEAGSLTSEPNTRNPRPLAVVAGRDEDTRHMLCAIFESLDCDVREAASCGDAPDLAAACGPDIVVLDAAIPFTESLEAASSLNNNQATSGIPVVMMSGFSQNPFRTAALAQGVSEYFAKPVDFDALASSVRRLLAGARATLKAQRRPFARAGSVI